MVTPPNARGRREHSRAARKFRFSEAAEICGALFQFLKKWTALAPKAAHISVPVAKRMITLTAIFR